MIHNSFRNPNPTTRSTWRDHHPTRCAHEKYVQWSRMEQVAAMKVCHHANDSEMGHLEMRVC